MAHFAQIENDLVTNVIVISNDDCNGGNFPESESVGQEFIASLGLPGLWLQTSYGSKFRHCYAGPGYKYLKDADVFITPQPFKSWKLNHAYEWEAPKPYPDDDSDYYWNEDSQEWIKK
jgi:hypothetical protein